MWGRGGLLEAESERWSAPELYDVWVPGCEAQSALSTWDFFFLKRTDLGSSAAAWQWWMASTCDLSVFTAQQSKNMIDHHVMGESREGLQEELSDCWNKMEPSVKVKQNHHSLVFPSCGMSRDFRITFDTIKSFVLTDLNSQNSLSHLSLLDVTYLYLCRLYSETLKTSNIQRFKETFTAVGFGNMSAWDLHCVRFS